MNISNFISRHSTSLACTVFAVSLLIPSSPAFAVSKEIVQLQTQVQQLQDAVARLPEEQRLAVALVLVEGLSYKEAAHIMEVPIGTLTSRLARARDALQAVLGDGDGAGG